MTGFVHIRLKPAILVCDGAPGVGLRPLRSLTDSCPHLGHVIVSRPPQRNLMNRSSASRLVRNIYAIRSRGIPLRFFVIFICLARNEIVSICKRVKQIATHLSIASRREFRRFRAETLFSCGFMRYNRRYQVFLRRNTGQRNMPLKTSEAGKLMGLSREQVRFRCVNGEIDGAFRTKGGHWRIPEETVNDHLAMSGRVHINRPARSEVMQAFDTIKRAVVAGIEAGD